jgi:predicted branched-subunit amino acid permease
VDERPGDPDDLATSRSELFGLGMSYFVGGVGVSLVLANAGVAPWIVVLAAFSMYSATGTIALFTVVASGGAVAAGVLSAMLVSARFGILCVSLSARLRSVSPWWERALAATVAVDPSVAVAIRARTDEGARSTYWRAALWLVGGWALGSLAGLAVGSLVTDPAAWGFDAVIPASLIAVIGNAVRTRDAAVTAAGAVVVALALAPLLPAGVPVLVAVGAAVLGLIVPPARSAAS